MPIEGSLSVVAAYLLGYVNANRELANQLAFAEMRLHDCAGMTMQQATDEPKWGRTYRDEHHPGAVRHIVQRDGWRLDNQPGERGHVKKEVAR